MRDNKKIEKGSGPAAPGREQREQVATRFDPEIYQKVAEAAATNRCSMSAEVERRVVESFEPRFANYSLQSFGAHVMAAFRMGGELAAQGRPYSEWIKDPAVFDRAVALAVEALMSWRPEPRRDDAGNPIQQVVRVQILLSPNPADAGKLVFTPESEG